MLYNQCRYLTILGFYMIKKDVQENNLEQENDRDTKLKNIIDGLKVKKKVAKNTQKVESVDKDADSEVKDSDAVEEDARDLEIEELRIAVDDWRNKCLRQVAITENMKKINANEIEKIKMRANFGFAKDILEIYDIMLMAHKNLHDVFNNNEKNVDLEENESNGEIVNNDQNVLQGIKEGIDMTMDIFNKKLAKNNVLKVGELGDNFDYDLHQAIQTVDSEEYQSNQIVQVVRAGYMMEGQLLIPALVIVAK